MTSDNFSPAPTLDATASIADVEAAIPPNELDALSTLGDSRDASRWLMGDHAREWVDERGLPVAQVCKIIARRVDLGHERIRQYLYTSRAFPEGDPLRERFGGTLHYSRFEHARGCSDPAAALQGAEDGQMSLTDMRAAFPHMLDELKDVYSRARRYDEDGAAEILRRTIGELKGLG